MSRRTNKVHLSWVLALLLPFAASAQSPCDNDKIPASTPDSAFESNGDGTVTHRRTGLMWSQCVYGQATSLCTGAPTYLPWHLALQAADAADLAGYDDWRLPSRAELASLVEYCRAAPAQNTTVFPNTPSAPFWTSTPFAGQPALAWAVLFDHGAASPLSSTNGAYIRLVRTPERVYKVGDMGPAGGTIVYDKGSKSGGWRYLEAAPKAWNSGPDPWTTWGCVDTLVGATATAIGEGSANTDMLVESDCSTAASLAAEAVINGYDDWFLPSRDELMRVHDVLTIGTNFHDDNGLATMSYASSSELNENAAIAVDFAAEGEVHVHKTLATVVVRPVRTF